MGDPTPPEMPEPKQKIAIVGCGVFAQNHIRAWTLLDGAELVAVCDRHESRARAASVLAGGVPYFTDMQAMLTTTSPDVVDIVTSPLSHRSLAQICADNGTSAIIQKPLAMTLDESVAIVAAAERAGVTMMVHENFRFQQPIREVRRLLATGTIGAPRYCSVGFRTSYTVFPRENGLKHGNRLILMDMGVHVFDVARFLMGDIIDLSCKIGETRTEPAADAMASAILSFANGAIGVVEASSSSSLPYNSGLDTLITVEGEGGGITLGRRGEIAVRSGGDERFYSVGPSQPSWGDPRWAVVQDSVIQTCRHWVDAANGKVALELSVEDNLNTLAAVEACYLSAANGGCLVAPGEVLSDARQRFANATD